MAMVWFCPYCWQEVKEDDRICSNCGANLESFHSLDFYSKLLLGLKNPIVQKRMFVIELICRRKVRSAVQELCILFRKSSDTYELIAIADALYSIGAEESLSCISRIAFQKGNIILEKHVQKLLGFF